MLQKEELIINTTKIKFVTELLPYFGFPNKRGDAYISHYLALFVPLSVIKIFIPIVLPFLKVNCIEFEKSNVKIREIETNKSRKFSYLIMVSTFFLLSLTILVFILILAPIFMLVFVLLMFPIFILIPILVFFMLPVPIF